MTRRKIEDAIVRLLELELPVSTYVAWVVLNLLTLLLHFKKPEAGVGEWIVAVLFAPLIGVWVLDGDGAAFVPAAEFRDAVTEPA